MNFTEIYNALKPLISEAKIQADQTTIEKAISDGILIPAAGRDNYNSHFDPTVNGAYTQWIFKIYKTKPDVDFIELGQLLEIYHKNKNNYEPQYRNIASLSYEQFMELMKPKDLKSLAFANPVPGVKSPFKVYKLPKGTDPKVVQELFDGMEVCIAKGNHIDYAKKHIEASDAYLVMKDGKKVFAILPDDFSDFHKGEYRDADDKYLNAHRLKELNKHWNDLIDLIKNPSLVTDEDLSRKYSPDEIKLLKDPFSIKYMDNPSEELQKFAVEKNGGVIDVLFKMGIKPSEEVQKAAVTQNGNVISYIISNVTPSEEVQKAAAKNNGNGTIWSLLDAGIKPSEDVQRLAVQQDGYCIMYLANNDMGVFPSEEVQRLAVKNDGNAIEHLLDNEIEPSEEVKRIAMENGWDGKWLGWKI